MGKFTAYRNFLCNLLPQCFARALPSDQRFCLNLVDMMQYLCPKIIYARAGDPLDLARVAESMRQLVDGLLADARLDHGVVVLLDTPLCVPRNKCQQSRDAKRGDSTLSPVMDDKLYEKTARNAVSALVINQYLGCTLSGATVWRSLNCKLQLYRLVCHALVRCAVPQKRTLVIDDGIVISESNWERIRDRMIRNHGFTGQTHFAQECLSALLMSRHLTNRFVVFPDGVFKRLNPTGVGEADVKLCRFLMPDQGTRRYLVTSQDTDIIFILLQHLDSVGVDHIEALWLDTQTPQDKAAGINRPYRYIDVRRLYLELQSLFAREYPGVKLPIQTLIFLVTALETDFTEAYPSCLKLTPRVLWNAFSELHGPENYILFNDSVFDDAAPEKKGKSAERSVIKRTDKHTLAPSLRNVLAEAVVRQTEGVMLNHRACSTFFYALCQTRVRTDAQALGEWPSGVTLLDRDELFIKITHLERLINTEKTRVESRVAQAKQSIERPTETKDPAPKNKKIKLPTVKKPALQFVFDDAIEMDEEKAFFNPILQPAQERKRDALGKLASEALPPRYGVPLPGEMAARLCRQEWLMNYHMNGWRSAVFAQNCTDRLREASRWGWTRVSEAPHTAEAIERGDFNSTYFQFEFDGREKGLPVRAFQIGETVDVACPDPAFYEASMAVIDLK